MRIQRAADRVGAPWKNGGGTTWEAAVSPPAAGLDDFDWRISIAEVAKGGPFSTFPGIDRVLTVIAGAGLRLQIEGGGTVELDDVSPPLAFPGDAACTAELAGSPIHDLNVMCRRGRFRSRVQRLHGPTELICTAEMTALLAREQVSIGGEALDRDDIMFAAAGDRLLVAAGELVVVEIERA